MAISITWGTRVIFVPRTYTQLVQINPFEIRELDLDVFRLDLKDLEDDEVGMAFPDTHSHNTTVVVGGVNLARVISIINGYTITFEDGQYAVNLFGANSNVGDVVNVNQVSIRSSNSAGLVTTVTAADVANAVWDASTGDHVAVDTFGSAVSASGIANAVWDEATNNHLIVDTFGPTVAETTTAGIADAVWDELSTDHIAVGSTGATLSNTKDDITTLLSRITLARAVALDLLPAIAVGVILSG